MNLEDKQREVLARGKAERGEYAPDPDSVPARMYRYWYSQTEHPPLRENFCHYGRVVVFWAPLWWVFNHTVVPVTNPILNWMEKGGGTKVENVLLAPSRLYQRLGTREQRKKFWGGVGWVAVGVFVLAALALLVYGLMKDPSSILIGFAITIGAVAVLFGLIALLSWIGGNFEEKRKAAHRARMNAWYDGETDVPPWEKPKKKPGVIKRFFKGVGDLLVLLAQIVRVKKWKICPLVEIPVDDVDTAQAV